MGTHSVSVNALVNLLIGNDQVASRLAEYSKGVNVPVNFGGKNGALPSKSLMNFNKLVNNTTATLGDFTKTLEGLSKSKSILHWSQSAKEGINNLHLTLASFPKDMLSEPIGEKLINTYNGSMEKILRDSGRVLKGKTGSYSMDIPTLKFYENAQRTITRLDTDLNTRLENSGAMRTLASKGIDSLVADLSSLNEKMLIREYENILRTGLSYGNKEYSFLAQSASHNKEGKMVLVEKTQLQAAREALGMLGQSQYERAGISEAKATSYEGLSLSGTKLLQNSKIQTGTPKVIVLNDLFASQETTNSKGQSYLVIQLKGNEIATVTPSKGSKIINNITDGIIFTDPKFAKEYDITGAKLLRLAGTKGLSVSYDYKKQFSDLAYKGGLKDFWGNEVTSEMIQQSDMILTESSAKLAKIFKKMSVNEASKYIGLSEERKQQLDYYNKNIGSRNGSAEKLTNPLNETVNSKEAAAAFQAYIERNPLLNGTAIHEENINNKSSYSMTTWLDYLKMSGSQFDKVAEMFVLAAIKETFNAKGFAQNSGAGANSTLAQILTQKPELLKTSAFKPLIDKVFGEYSIKQVETLINGLEQTRLGAKAKGASGRAIAQKSLLEGISSYSYLVPEMESILEGWATDAFKINENGLRILDPKSYKLGKEEIIVGGKGTGLEGWGNIGRWPMAGMYRANNIGLNKRGKYYTGSNYTILSNATPYQSMLTGSDWDGDTGIFFNNSSVFGEDIFRQSPINTVKLKPGQLSWNPGARARRMAGGRTASKDLGIKTNLQTDVLSAMSRIVLDNVLVPNGRIKQNDLGVLNEYVNSLLLLRDANVDLSKNAADATLLILNNAKIAEKATEVLLAYGEKDIADSARLYSKALQNAGEQIAGKNAKAAKDTKLTLRIAERFDIIKSKIDYTLLGPQETEAILNSFINGRSSRTPYSALTHLKGETKVGGFGSTKATYENITELTGLILGFKDNYSTILSGETAANAERLIKQYGIQYGEMIGKTFETAGRNVLRYVEKILELDALQKKTTKSTAQLSLEYKRFNSEENYLMGMNAALKEGLYSVTKGSSIFNSAVIEKITTPEGETIALDSATGNKLGNAILSLLYSTGKQWTMMPDQYARRGEQSKIGLINKETKKNKGYELEYNGQKYLLEGTGMVAADSYKKIPTNWTKIAETFVPANMAFSLNLPGFVLALNTWSKSSGYGESRKLIENVISESFGGIGNLKKASSGSTFDLMATAATIQGGGNLAVLEGMPKITSLIYQVLTQAAASYVQEATYGTRFEENGALTERGIYKTEQFRLTLKSIIAFTEGTSLEQTLANIRDINANLLRIDKIETLSAKKREKTLKNAGDVDQIMEDILANTKKTNTNNKSLEADIVAMANESANESTITQNKQQQVVGRYGFNEHLVSDWRIEDLQYMSPKTSFDYADKYKNIISGFVGNNGYLVNSRTGEIPKLSGLAKDHTNNLQTLNTKTSPIEVFSGFESFRTMDIPGIIFDSLEHELKGVSRNLTFNETWGIGNQNLEGLKFAKSFLLSIPSNVFEQYLGTNIGSALQLYERGFSTAMILSEYGKKGIEIPEYVKPMIEGILALKGTYNPEQAAWEYVLNSPNVDDGMLQYVGQLAAKGNWKIADYSYGGENFLKILGYGFGENSQYYKTAMEIDQLKNAGAPQEFIKSKLLMMQYQSAILPKIAQLQLLAMEGKTDQGFLDLLNLKDVTQNNLLSGLKTAIQKALTADTKSLKLYQEAIAQGMSGLFKEAFRDGATFSELANNKSIATEMIIGKYKSLPTTITEVQSGNSAQQFMALREGALTGVVGNTLLTAEQQSLATAQYTEALNLAMNTIMPTGLSGVVSTIKQTMDATKKQIENAKNYEANLKKRIEAESALESSKKELRNTTELNRAAEAKQKQIYNEQKAAATRLGGEYEMALKEYMMSTPSGRLTTYRSARNRTREYTEAKNQADSQKAYLEDMIATNKATEAQLRETVAQNEAAFNEANSLVAQSKEALKVIGNLLTGAMFLKNLGAGLINKSNLGMMEMMGAQMVFEQFKGIVSGMYSYVEAFDSQMREYKKILPNWNEKDMRNYVRGLSDLGLTYGKTVEEMAEASIVMTRGGYGGSTESAKQINRGMTEVALLMSSIADEELSVSDAADLLISVTKAYGVEDVDAADFSTRVTDMVNEVSNNFAVTSNGLMEALPIVSSAAAVQGIDTAELIGLITGGAEISQDPSKTATAMKTMLGRFNQINDASSSTGRWLENWLNNKIGSEGYRDENGQLDFYKMVQSVGSIWDTLTMDEQSLFGLKLAGSRQASNFANLMQNLEGITSATDTARGSSGSAAKSNAEKMDSIEGRMSQLQATISDIGTDTLNSGVFKNVISVANALATMFNAIPGSSAVLGITAITAMLGALSSLVPAMAKFYGMGALGGLLNLGGTVLSGKDTLLGAFLGTKTGKSVSNIGQFFKGMVNYKTANFPTTTAATIGANVASFAAPLLPYIVAIAATVAALKIAAAQRDKYNENVVDSFNRLLLTRETVENKRDSAQRQLIDISNKLLETDLKTEGYVKGTADFTEAYKNRAKKESTTQEEFEARAGISDEYDEYLLQYKDYNARLEATDTLLKARENQYFKSLTAGTGAWGMLRDANPISDSWTEDVGNVISQYRFVLSALDLLTFDQTAADYASATGDTAAYNTYTERVENSSANLELLLSELTDDWIKIADDVNTAVKYARTQSDGTLEGATKYLEENSELFKHIREILQSLGIYDEATYNSAMLSGEVDIGDLEQLYLDTSIGTVAQALGSNYSAALKVIGDGTSDNPGIVNKDWKDWTGEDVANLYEAFQYLPEDQMNDLLEAKYNGMNSNGDDWNTAFKNAIGDNLTGMFGFEGLKDMAPELIAKYLLDWGIKDYNEALATANELKENARDEYERSVEAMETGLEPEVLQTYRDNAAKTALIEGSVSDAVNKLEYETDTRKAVTDEEGNVIAYLDTISGLIDSLNDMSIGVEDAGNMFEEWLDTNKFVDKNGNEIDMSDPNNRTAAWLQFSEEFIAGSDESITALNTNTAALESLNATMLLNMGLDPEDFGYGKTESGLYAHTETLETAGYVLTKDKDGNPVYINPNDTNYILAKDGEKITYFETPLAANEAGYSNISGLGYIANALKGVSWDYIDGKAQFVGGFDPEKSDYNLYSSEAKWDQTANDGRGGYVWKYTPTANNPNYKNGIPITNYNPNQQGELKYDPETITYSYVYLYDPEETEPTENIEEQKIPGGTFIKGQRTWSEELQDRSTDTIGRAAIIDTPLGDKVKDLFGKIGDGLSDLIPKAEAGLVKDNYSDTTMDNTVRGELQKDGKITYEAEVEDVEIPEVEDLQMTIEADTSDAQAKLELLGQMDIPTVDVKVEAKLANAKILDVTSGIEGVEGQTPTVTVDAKDNASKTLDKIKSTVNSIPSNKTITVSVSGAESAANKLAHLKAGSARGGIIGSTAPQQIGERHADGGVTGKNGLVGTWLGDEYNGSGEKKPELVVTPDGNAHLAGLNGWEYENLPKGTRVYSNKETKQLLGERHATGGFLGKLHSTSGYITALAEYTWEQGTVSITDTGNDNNTNTKTSAAAAATAKSTANVEGYVEDIAESLKTLVEQYDTMISVIDDSLDLLEYEEEKTDKPSEKRFELLANKLDVLTKYQKALEDAGATTENSADYRDVLKQVEEVKAEKLEAIIAGYEHRLDANETKRALIEEQNYMDPLAGFDDLMATYASDREMINKQIQAYLDAGYSWGSDEIRDRQEKLIDVNESERDLIDEKTDKIIDKIDESIDTQDSIDKYAKHLIDQKREEIEENVEYMQQQYDDETEELSKLDTIIDRQKRLLDAEADLTEAENKRVLVLGDNGWEWDSNPQEVEDAKKALQDTKDAIAKEERDEKRADELKEKIAAEWEKYYGEGSEGKKAYATLDSIYEQEKELADRQEEMNLLESKVLFQEEYGNALLEDVLQSLNSEAKQEEIKLKYIDKYVMDILNDEAFSGIDFSKAIDKNGNVDIMAAVQLAIDKITAKQDISEDLQNLLNKALKLRGEKQLTLGAALADNIEVTNKGLVDANGNLIETKATSATTAENTAEAKETSAATAENTAETNDKLDESNKIAHEAIKKYLAATEELLDQMRENGTITEDCYYALLSMLKPQQGTTTTTTTTESSGGKSVSRASSSTWGYAQQMLEDGREISDYGMYMINGGTGSEAEYREWQEKLNQKISDKNNAVSSNSSTDNSTNISVDNLNVNANNADELVQSMLNYKNANSSSKGNSSNKNSLANKSGSSVSHAIKF